ncbi:MAG: ABC transporter, partial [Clostridia bacterium]|nr:ABC transporter [Clostridia bacterium]
IPSDNFTSLICFGVLALIVGAVTYALTKNTAASVGIFCLLAAALIVLYLIKPEIFGGLFPALLTYLAVFDRFIELTGGIFDVTAIVYLVTFAAFFVYLTVQSVEKRRWS